MGENLSSLIKQLKWDFYDWCGLLSIDEIASNRKLLLIIERVERMLKLEEN